MTTKTKTLVLTSADRDMIDMVSPVFKNYLIDNCIDLYSWDANESLSYVCPDMADWLDYVEKELPELFYKIEEYVFA